MTAPPWVRDAGKAALLAAVPVVIGLIFDRLFPAKDPPAPTPAPMKSRRRHVKAR
jgi:hypothetical protein